MWLECIGVASRCCCKEVYRYPHNNYYFSLLHLYQLFFWQQHPNFVHFKFIFVSFLFMLFLCNIANVAQRIFEIIQLR